MRTRPRWLLLIAGALVVLALYAFPAWWPLVSDAPPDVLFPGASEAERVLLETIQAIDPTQAVAIYVAGTPTIVPEEDQVTPEMEMPIIVARGEFTALDALHWARGEVTLYRSGREMILRFENFTARNGPNLYVLLSVHPEPRTAAEVNQGAGAIEVGPLQGSEGDQTYIVPETIDAGVYNSVVIFSRAFETVFSTATLTPEEF